MKTLTVQVPDEVYEVFHEMAAKDRRTTEEVVLEWLARKAPPHWGDSQLSAEEAAARLRFERHFGAWDSGDPRSADNERIDTELAREYKDSLEREA